MVIGRGGGVFISAHFIQCRPTAHFSEGTTDSQSPQPHAHSLPVFNREWRVGVGVERGGEREKEAVRERERERLRVYRF